MIVYQGYQIKADKTTPTVYVIAFDGGRGKIPNCLNGMYTSTGLAKRHIDDYLEGRMKKG